jgi:hypothetical protein
MEQQNVAPVDHGILSTTGTVAAGAVGGGLKSGIKAFAWTVGIFAVVGILAATGVLPVMVEVGTAGAAGTFWPLIGKIMLGAGVGGAIGILPGIFTGTIGSTIGAVKGAGQASNRVSQEKGAAKVVDAQVEAYKAQAQAEAMAAAASAQAPVPFPPQGVPMNPASTKLFAANDNAYANDNGLEHQGTVNAQRQIQQG